MSAALLVSLLWTAGLPDGAQGWLYQPAFCMDYELRGPAVPYVPQPGDIFMASDGLFIAKAGHYAARTGAPQHSGIVVALPDGRPGLLESGPHNTLYVGFDDLLPHLSRYAERERVWVRRRRVPLTEEQSARLTAFALAAQGRRFGIAQILGQLTPFRVRTPWSIRWRGKSRAVDFQPGTDCGMKRAYLCSELVIEACVVTGLVCAETVRPAAVYPRDLFFGRSTNRWIDRHLDLSAWEPPARWTLCPGSEPPVDMRWHRMDRNYQAR
jgi:hypothetical protein